MRDMKTEPKNDATNLYAVPIVYVIVYEPRSSLAVRDRTTVDTVRVTGHVR